MTEPIRIGTADDLRELIDQAQGAVKDLGDISLQAQIWYDDPRVGDLESIASEASDSAGEVVRDLQRILREVSR